MAVKAEARSRGELLAENERLRLALEEAEQTLHAIRSGEVDALVVSALDGGERIFTLQGADRSYRALIEEMSEGALNLTRDGLILYANQSFAAMLNEPLKNVIGSSIQAWVAPECQNVLAAVLRDAARDKSRAELTLAAVDGTSVPVYLSVVPIVMDELREHLGAVVLDLSEQKRAEQALRESETKFRSTFHNASIGKILRSMDGKVEANSAILNMLGYSEEEVGSSIWEQVLYPEDAPVARNAFRALEEGRLPGARFEMRLLHKNGSIVWADVTTALVRDPAGNPLYTLTSIYDITPRKEADAALQDLKQHLQRYMEAERQNLAQDLHDVPLQDLYSILYRLEELRPKSQPQNAQVIGGVIDDVKATLSSLRSIATELRPPPGSKAGFGKAAQTYIQQFREKHPGMQIHASLKPDRQALPEDIRVLLFRVLQEAFSNTVRHAQATEVNVTFELDEREACLEITDNGKGFTVPENWARLARAGHYGLAGMVERVSVAGGSLTVTSTPGTSTTVRVVLPYSASRSAAARKRPPRKRR